MRRLRLCAPWQDKIPRVAKYGEYWYNFWTDAQNPRGLWRRTTPESYKTDSPEWEVVIDVDALGDCMGKGGAEGCCW